MFQCEVSGGGNWVKTTTIQVARYLAYGQKQKEWKMAKCMVKKGLSSLKMGENWAFLHGEGNEAGRENLRQLGKTDTN